jgi:hypothetical protein
MSIARVAPDKFDFQDFVCIDMMLRFAAYANARCLIEPDDGEDAQITLGPSGVETDIEIQVKGSGEDVDIERIADCLAHAPPLSSTDTLLERLVVNPRRFAVLVMMGRCDNASAAYVMPTAWSGSEHEKDFIRLEDARQLLAAYVGAEPKGKETELKLQRRRHRESVASGLDLGALRTALRRLIVLERTTAEEVKARLLNHLLRQHHIPLDRAESVFAKLHGAIKEGRTQRCDSFPLVRAILDAESPPSVRPFDYVLRGDEAELHTTLSNNHVLLLSGPPRVGKSNTARWVAAEFEAEGFKVIDHSSLDDAERFLRDPSRDLRLSVLDDPLGQIHPTADAPRILMRLEQLARRLGASRRLIVAQAQAPLLSASGKADLKGLRTAGHAWRDVSQVTAEFRVRLWDRISNEVPVAEPMRAAVAQALARGELQLEAGCLQYLASHHGQHTGAVTPERLERLAREDAGTLGQVLASHDFRPLLTALSVASSAREPIHLPDLAYVCGSGDPLPIAPADFEENSVCTYSAVPSLAPENRARLDDLEHQRIVDIDRSCRVHFSHAYYRAAGEHAADGSTFASAQDIVEVVERGLSCPTASTSRASARNLAWTFARLQTRPELRERLIQFAISGTESRFPATRDLCLQFLLGNLQHLPSQQQKHLPEWVSNAAISLDSLHWIGGEAQVRHFVEFDLEMLVPPSWESVSADVAALSSESGAAVTAERAAKALRYFQHHPQLLDRTALSKLLSYDEAALRAAATESWLSRPRDDDEDLLERIFNETHPSMALAALRGLIEGWHVYDATRQDTMLTALKELASVPAAATALIDMMVVFGRVEYTGRDTPWRIFEVILPAVMRAMPALAAFNYARLYAVAKEALKVLPPQSMLEVCDGWLDWLERKIAAGRLPDDFSLGVADALLLATATAPDLRAGRIARLLRMSGTGAKLSIISTLVDHWERLSEAEQRTLAECISGGGIDRHWLQAVVLTRSVVPEQLQALILGDRIRLGDAAPDRLIASLPAALSEACVRVYCGMPQPLWYIGTHHRGRQTWDPVIETIVRTPSHPLFEVAWQEVNLDGDAARVGTVIASLGLKHAERVLMLMIRTKVNRVGDFMPQAWATLLGLAPDAHTRERWLHQIAEYATGMLEELSDAAELFSEEKDRHTVLSNLNGDLLALGILKHAALDVEVRAPSLDVLLRLLRDMPPRLMGTCQDALRIIDKHNIDNPELRMHIETRLVALRNTRDRIRQDMQYDEGSIDATWVRP